MPLGIRNATSADLDRLVAVHTSAFPDPRGANARVRNFTQNPLGTLDDLRVAEQDGRVVGHAFLFRMGIHYGGRVVPAGGIASVGVAPEARGRGVATALLAHLHAESDARGYAVTLLYAFRYDFYRRLGYARVATGKRLSFAPESVPREWVGLARGADVREAGGHDRGDIMALHARCAARGTGALDRVAGQWTALLLDERVRTLLLSRDGRSVGYVALEHVQREAHGETRVFVHDLVADDDEALRALVGVLGAQAGQASEIDLDCARDDTLDLVLSDMDARRHGSASLEHAFGTVVGGPMVRVTDTRRALEARGYLVDGEASFAVVGESLRVAAQGGKATVTASKHADFSLDRVALAATAFGSLSLREAASLGMVRGDAGAIARASELFGMPPFFSRDTF